MISDPDRSTSALWARFRFSVVGGLLSSPPAHGALKAALESLAAKTWTHPVSGCDVRFAAPTIARWYYTARRAEDDPVGALRRAVRKDCGRVSLPPALADALFRQYRVYEHWTYQLHYDNLTVRVKADPSLGPLPSYSTVRRYMQAHGLVRKRRAASKARPGEQQAARRREVREVRSYEAEYVGALWHLDFHHGSIKVLTSRGRWQRPLALGILDDHSRLCCHLQWYLSETADFYRELGEVFSVKLRPSNRYGGFKALRERWRAHLAATRIKPVLLIDEAQEMAPEVLSELRLLSSADFDATSLLTMVLSGDGRLLELPRHPDLIPLGTRIRTRLNTEAASREELGELLRHALAKAGNASLMTPELIDTLADHAAGNYRLPMTLGGELLAYGMTREVAQLDEKCFLELFQSPRVHPTSKRKARA